MALVLPPSKAPAANPKVPPVSAVPKQSAGPAEGLAKVTLGKFQALLDHASASKKTAADPAAAEKLNAEKSLADKTKAAKAKASDLPAERAKDPKKAEPKEPKAEGAEALAASLALQPKVEAPKPAAKVSEAETALAAAKAVKSDRRAAADVPAPVTAASAEIAQAQAQQKAPRAERSEDKQKVFVVDRRSDKEKEKLRTPGAEAATQQPVNAAVELQPQTKTADPKAANEIQVTFQAVGGKGKDGFDLAPQNTPVSPRDAASFQQYLVDRGYGQLVDQARIVLKDQNAGEIRMTLYPESLGKVKVALDLSDNTLAGQIFVENQTVKDVFQSNMDGLLQAFRDGGWDDLSLQVSVGGEGGTGTQNQQPQTGSQARDYGRQVAQTLGVEGLGDRIGAWNDRQINLTA